LWSCVPPVCRSPAVQCSANVTTRQASRVNQDPTRGNTNNGATRDQVAGNPHGEGDANRVIAGRYPKGYISQPSSHLHLVMP
jgi:hypothetical protein